ncbi:hypothetical protein L1987_01601 [Smallanthus sonchifolius]|uniref:Uncharacterized protein n=1 Tax=Smallanthus sonchifolius TaxID=185202 RepID=A0ACB9K5N8_9ASTR|nr:hypothetical protein L1987_01601 [Smallanthus sonchifolius]
MEDYGNSLEDENIGGESGQVMKIGTKSRESTTESEPEEESEVEVCCEDQEKALEARTTESETRMATALDEGQTEDSCSAKDNSEEDLVIILIEQGY